MHITGVELTDFRSHKTLSLSFVDGVNALIGSSNNGKTNVMRAIRWCLTNQPNGTDVVRIGAKEAKVVTHLSNGFSIERVRGLSASNNFYRLYREGELVEEYTGFGQKVPTPIRRAHGMSLDRDNSMNFHDQLETAFLVASRPSERADYIGNLEELAKVDRASSGLNEEIRDRSKEAKRMDQDIAALELEIERVRASLSTRQSRRESLKLMLEAFDEESYHLTKLDKRIEMLNRIIERLEEARQTIETYKRTAEGFPEHFEPDRVNRLFVLAQEAKMTEERLKALKADVEMDVASIEEYHVLVEGSLLNTSRIESLHAELDTNRRKQLEHLPFLSEEVQDVVLHDFNAIDDSVEAHRALFRHHVSLKGIDERRNELSALADSLSKENDQLLDDMLAMLVEAGHCTTCGQSTAGLTHDCVGQTI